VAGEKEGHACERRNEKEREVQTSTDRMRGGHHHRLFAVIITIGSSYETAVMPTTTAGSKGNRW
jgi:hypothetical protein